MLTALTKNSDDENYALTALTKNSDDEIGSQVWVCLVVECADLLSIPVIPKFS
jgi:hypothetical protein